MKTRKIIARIEAFIDADRRAQLKQADAIKEVLAKLREKEHKLKEKLENTPDQEARGKIERKLAVCHAQRKKGLAILKELKSQGT